ncbi:MAG: aminotransferase class V-fold PLP-dependent enzyme [Paracoccaceae bacterium]
MKNDKSNLMRPFGLPQSASTPVVTPLSPSVVYASASPDMLDAQYEGGLAGFTYAREGHPNAHALAKRIDALEGVDGGLVTGSGMAAVSAALLGILKTGDHVVAGDQLYGRSLRLLKEDLPRLGIEVSLCDATRADNVLAALRPNTKIILLEAVSNPTLRVADIAGVAAAIKGKGIQLVVDNTFTTPLPLKPAELGADIIVHSVTKLLAGHSDVTLGYVWARKKDISHAINVFCVTTGMTPSPFDCWLAEQNAVRLADALASHPKIARVLYPMREDHPDVDAAKQLLGEHGCNMVSIELSDQSRGAANRFVEHAREIAFAPTLGDVGTTLSHPASSSHRALSADERMALGISEGFFRISVGIEDVDALIRVFSDAASLT